MGVMGCFNSKKSDMSDQASEGESGNVQYPDLTPLSDTHPQASLKTHSPRRGAARELERAYRQIKETARDDLEQQRSARAEPNQTLLQGGKGDQTGDGDTIDRGALDLAMGSNSHPPTSHGTKSEGQRTNEMPLCETQVAVNPTSAQSEGVEDTDPQSLPQQDSAPTQDQQQLEPSQQAMPTRLDLPTTEDVNVLFWRRDVQAAQQQQQTPGSSMDPHSSDQNAGENANTQDQGEVSQSLNVSPRKAYVEDAEDSGL